MAQQPTLQCTRCSQRFTREDILKGSYWLETSTCMFCYQRFQRQPYHVCCFGKPTLLFSSGKKLLGYDPKAVECQQVCPDRKICKVIVTGRLPR